MRGPRLYLALPLFGCAGAPARDPADVPDNGQSPRDAIATICEVDQSLGLGADADVFEAAERRAEYLKEHVKNPDGIYFYTLFRVQPPGEQVRQLREQAAEVGLSRCALADSIERENG